MAGPFGMSLGGSHLFQHHMGSGAMQRSSQQQRNRNLRRLTAAAAAATAGAAGVQLYRTGRLAPLLPQRPAAKSTQPLLQIPRELADVICGAFGEIVQVAILYPLDTIKVRCQAGGLPVKAVLQQLMGPGSNPTGVLRQLYAGVVSASLASVVVGSLYYLTFCAAKRAATKMVAKSEQAQAASTAAAAAGAAGLTIKTTRTSSSSGCSHSNSGTPHAYPHGSGADLHCHDAVFAAICSDDRAAAAAAHQQHLLDGKQAPAAAATAAVAASGAGISTPSSTTTTASSSSNPTPELSSHGKLQANILAACAAAVVGALVEAPVELFKHRAQAGQLQGSMVAAVTSALKQHGPAALYGSFFIPFLFKSLPFDIGELMTYSSLNDWRAAAVQKATTTAPAAAAAAPAPGKAVLPAAPAASETASLAVGGSSMPALASLTAASISNSSSAGLLSPVDFVRNMPDHVWDMAVGAAAGAAAVLISMPPDCIKTVMETGGGVQASGGGPLRSAAAFAGTGRQLVAQHGPRGLFMGLAPRLAESVPSTALYWICVEACRRMLEPYVAPEPAAAAGGASS